HATRDLSALPGFRAITAALVLAVLSSCGGGDSTGPGPDDPDGPVDPAVSGLDARPSNTSCLAGPAPGSGLALDTEQVFAGAGGFTSPVQMLQEPQSDARWYVVQQNGPVYVFDNQANVSSRREFINLSGAIAG